jgi:predicted transcriptional regulator YdeE
MFKSFGRLAAIVFFFAAASCFLTAALGSPEERITRLIIGGMVVIIAAAILVFDAFRIEKVEPKIVTLREPMQMIGISTRTGMKTIFKDAARLGQQYKKVKDASLIQNKKQPWGFVAVSRDFHGMESWEYLMGDVVNCVDVVPAGLKCFEIPPMTYAVFPIRPRSRFSWGITIGLTKKYIFTEWLPKSNYEADNSILGDFEYHDERSLAKNPEIDLYVAIKEKKQ